MFLFKDTIIISRHCDEIEIKYLGHNLGNIDGVVGLIVLNYLAEFCSVCHYILLIL